MNDSFNRPKIKIKKTTSEWFWDIIGYSTFIAMIGFLFFLWNKLPEEVPAHFNASGEVDRWGSKTELLILPIIGFFTIIILQLLEKFPEVHNYPKRLNENNAKQFYLNSRKLINQIKNICLIIFTVIVLESIIIAMEWGTGFGAWSLPLLTASTLIPIVVLIIKNRKIQ